MVHSIEAYCSGFPRAAMVLFASNSMALLLLISNSVSAPSSSSTYMIAPKPDPVRLESKRMKFLTVTISFTTLTPNGLTRQIRQLFP